MDTGSGLKDGKLKSKDFFDVKPHPLMTFHSTKTVQTGPNTFDIAGKFTIRGVTKDETLHLLVSGQGTGTGDIKGTMVFDRKDYGMQGINFQGSGFFSASNMPASASGAMISYPALFGCTPSGLNSVFRPPSLLTMLA